MFSYFVRHERTKYVAMFKGQGESIADSFKEGYANLTYGHINPSTSGGAGTNLPPKIAVRLPDGRTVNMKREDFESGAPFVETVAPNPAPRTPEQVARTTAGDAKWGSYS